MQQTPRPPKTRPGYEEQWYQNQCSPDKDRKQFLKVHHDQDHNSSTKSLTLMLTVKFGIVVIRNEAVYKVRFGHKNLMVNWLYVEKLSGLAPERGQDCWQNKQKLALWLNQNKLVLGLVFKSNWKSTVLKKSNRKPLFFTCHIMIFPFQEKENLEEVKAIAPEYLTELCTPAVVGEKRALLRSATVLLELQDLWPGTVCLLKWERLRPSSPSRDN